MFNLIIVLKISLNSILKNKFRSILTLLGIILGIASVVSMYNFGLGLQAKTEEEIKNLGTNIIVISKYQQSRGHFQQSEPITLSDMEAIKSNCSNIQTLVPFFKSYSELSRNNNTTSVNIIGTTPDYFLIGDKKLAIGSYLGNIDISRASKVCVIGYSAANTLFKSENPIDKTIVVNNVPLKIIGVLDEFPSFSAVEPSNVNYNVIIPYTAFAQNFNNSSGIKKIELENLIIVVENSANIYKVQSDIKTLLRQRYKLDEKEKDLFAVETFDEYIKLMKERTLKLTIFLKITAIIALLVGGINIMNIMLVTVKERTREIGIRMALGARSKDIVFQFLAESIFLCFIGGMIGVLLSIPLSLLLTNMSFFNTPVKFSFSMVTIAFVYSSAVGIIFGLYPARKASLLNPIDALRYE